MRIQGWIRVAAVVVAAVWGMGLSFARDLSFEQRVKAQEAIERVYWRHRIWPKENPQPKPPLSAVMAADALRAKVEDYLKRSNALEKWWQQPITAVQLQAEMDRMAKSTRDGGTLHELYAALGDDPFVIAETLARQTLAERLIRNWYASDTRFHGDLRRQAEEALAGTVRVAGMKVMGGEYTETTFLRRDDRKTETARPPEAGVVELDSGEWKELMADLARRFGTTPEAIPLEQVSALREDPDAFSATAVLSAADGRAVIASVNWPKRSFEAWWAETGRAVSSEVAVESVAYAMTAPALDSCTYDTWQSRSYGPDVAFTPVAVWTGAEMLVWGESGRGGRYNPSTDTWTAMSTGPNAPEGRTYLSAVWTGTEMIVWGGLKPDLSFGFNTGGRYNPTTNVWTATSTGANAPSPRGLHTAVWTGTEMIVWGGGTNGNPVSGFVNTGGRYNPATDTWVETSTGVNLPKQRLSHTAVWTGTEMIVWGGVGWDPDMAQNTLLDTGGRYNPSTNSWTTSTQGGAPSARWLHTAVWTDAEMIVWGGSDGITSLNQGGRYNPTTDSWTATSTGANTPAGRARHSAVWTGAVMIIWGGDFGYPTSGYFNTGGRYDPATNSWMATSTGANVPAARTQHAAVWTGTEMIVWGGVNNLTGELDTGGRYKPSTDSWTGTYVSVGPPTPRRGHTSVWTGTEMIVWGGFSSGVYLMTGGRYDPATDSWTATSTGANVPGARRSHTAVWTGAEMIVWGGYTGSSYLNTGGRYKPATNSWAATTVGANLPAARGDHTAVWAGATMIVWGGYTGSSYLNTGGRYNPSADSWTATSVAANVPSPRAAHSAVWTGSEMIVWGGYNGAADVNTGGRYNASTNTWTATPTGANTPSARESHTAVWTDAEMIVWGGWDRASDLNTGGRYSPSTNSWTATSTGANTPSARQAHVAVWTGASMTVWGGRTVASPFLSGLNTGGQYSPSTDSWTPTGGDASAPYGRARASAAFIGPQMLVWGGDPQTRELLLYCAACVPTTYYRDADGDGYGDAAVTTATCHGMPPGYVPSYGDCDDGDRAIYPGAPQVCDGKNNNCSDPSWPALPPNEADGDGDGWSACAGDCAPGDPTVYPGAPEVNDGLDNQCPGSPGYGVIDEVSGNSGFLLPGDANSFCWIAQAGATSYLAVRSSDPQFRSDCGSQIITSGTCWSDPAQPTAGQGAFYLVKALTPHEGSWGRTSAGVERTVTCLHEAHCADDVDNDGDGLIDCADPDCYESADCMHTFSFTDTFADDVAPDALYQFFSGFVVDSGAYILFQIDEPNLGAVNAWCSQAADTYRTWYLTYAQSGGYLYTGSWAKWARNISTGQQWVGPDVGAYPNGFDASCTYGLPYAWCSQIGLSGLPSRSVNPAWGAGQPCEIYDNYVGCGNGTWRLTIRVAPSRQSACGF